MLHQLKQNPTALKEYNNAIKEQLRRGVIEPVPVRETTHNRTHYMLHHTVVHRDKLTTKLHIVYNASARSNDSLSLNNCLQKGLKLNHFVLDLLLRFRAYEVALTALSGKGISDDLYQ